MSVQRVALADIAPQPWRNGGGLRRDLLVWPVGGAERLRVSLARIERSGPFSAYPGHRRLFALVAGDGVVLGLRAADATVTPSDPQALVFDGAEAPHCRLQGAACDALNLMVTDGTGTPRLWRGAPGDRVTGPWRAVYAGGVARLQADGQACTLPAGTLAWSDDAAQAWTLQQGDAWLMSI